MSNFEKFKFNIFLTLFAWFKIPLIGFCRPCLIERTDQKVVLKVPLGYKTRNHLKSMYFGALAIGSELCIAMLAVQKIKEHMNAGGDRIDFLFKDYKAQFLKRAEGDVHFICEEVPTVIAQIEEAKKSEERINRTMKAYAVVPSIDPYDRVAEFELTLSVKRRVRKG